MLFRRLASRISRQHRQQPHHQMGRGCACIDRPSGTLRKARGMKVHHLQLGDRTSPFDETVLTINGREEETVTIEATGSREIAKEIAWLINHRGEIIDALVGAANALRNIE